MSRLLEASAALGSAALLGVGLLPFLHQEPAPDAWFEIMWPRDVDEDHVIALLRHLSALRRPPVVVLELVANRGQVSHRIGIANADSERMRHLFATHLPDVLLEPVEREQSALKHAVELRLATRERSIRTDAPEEVARAVNGSAASTPGVTVIQLVLGTRLAPHHVPAESVGMPTNAQLVKRTMLTGHEPLDARSRAALQDKVGEHGFRTVLRVATNTPEPKTARSALRSVLGGLRVSEASGAHLRGHTVRARLVTDLSMPRRWPMALNASELLGLLGWPLGDRDYRGITRVGSRRLPASPVVPRAGRVVGVGNHPSTLRPVAQSARDSLMHSQVLGPTGVGKSTLLARLAIDDIHAGRGVVVIEPKGDLVEDILARIPKHREHDVVVLDPSDPEAPVGINPLRGGVPELISDQVLAVFRGLYGDYLGPRTSDVLASALLTLARSESPTLVALPLLLSDDQFRRRITKPVRGDLALGPFWNWFDSLSDAERNQVVAPVMNKVRPFLLRERVRHVLGQITPAFDITSVFTERKILLVPLSKGTLGSEASSLIGSLVVARLWQAAQGRARIAPERRHPVSVVIDEFQDFLHLPTDLADVLAQARGLGLGLTLAHQHLAQLTPDIRAAVLANARSKICFRLSAEDAAVMARSTDILDVRDFQSIGRYEIYASLVSDGESQPFCSAATGPLHKTVTNPARLRALSRDQYGRHVADIEAELRALWQPVAVNDSDSVIGSRALRRDDSDGGAS